MKTTYQDRINIVIDRVGDQTKLAHMVSAIRNERTTPQAMQKLASRTSKIPARGSTMTTAIATAGGVRPQWLEYGEEPMVDPLGKVDRSTYTLILEAVAKLAAPNLDPDVRNTALGALRMVAKQDVDSYQVNIEKENSEAIQTHKIEATTKAERTD